jgi:hypothetical protein
MERQHIACWRFCFSDVLWRVIALRRKLTDCRSALCENTRSRQFSDDIATHVCDRQQTRTRVACEKSHIAVTSAHDESAGRTAHPRVWIASSADSVDCINSDPSACGWHGTQQLGVPHVR